jgi:histidine triad (HIT) family protein
MVANDSEPCVFCAIAMRKAAADIVYEDELTVSFVDLRQFHRGHMLVIPRAHCADVRDLDDKTGAALMATVVLITRAVGHAFPNEGISLWHSIGPAAFQEVPHLHIHVHPRRTDDGFLRVYPGTIENSSPEVRKELARRIREALSSNDATRPEY